MEQPGNRLAAHVHGRPRPLWGLPAPRRARSTRISRRRLASRLEGGGPRDRVRRSGARSRPPSRDRLRPQGRPAVSARATWSCSRHGGARRPQPGRASTSGSPGRPRSAPRRRPACGTLDPRTRPGLGAGAAYLGLVAAGFAASLDRGFPGTGRVERRLWLGQAGALSARPRSRVGPVRVASRPCCRSPARHRTGPIATARRPRDGLADRRRPELVLGYPLDISAASSMRRAVRSSWPKAASTTSSSGTGRSRRPRSRAGTPRRRAARRRGRGRGSPRARERAASSRGRARLEELRASRARIVEAGDAERRRLERDLHDGAQQRLVGLSLSVRLVRSQLARRRGGAHPAR